jgi:hypothetical protein
MPPAAAPPVALPLSAVGAAAITNVPPSWNGELASDTPAAGTETAKAAAPSCVAAPSVTAMARSVEAARVGEASTALMFVTSLSVGVLPRRAT